MSIGFPGACAVIPHYDNAEGGTHDTRFCYLGERRLAAMEALLPDDGWVLGIDEHTALIVDLDAREATVTGRGVVTVRRRGASQQFPAGERLSLTRSSPPPGATCWPPSHRAQSHVAAGRRGARRPRRRPPSEPKRSPLLSEVARLEQAFEAALAERSAAGAAEAILHLDRAIQEWATDSLQTDDPDRARAVLHSLIHRLGEAAGEGLRDPRELLAPLVESLLALRWSSARPGPGNSPIASARSWSPPGSSFTTPPPARSGSCAVRRNLQAASVLPLPQNRSVPASPGRDERRGLGAPGAPHLIRTSGPGPRRPRTARPA